MKQETLEEAMDRLYNYPGQAGILDKHSFMQGAFWQAKKMYSEEDLKQAFFSGCFSERQIKSRIDCWKEWFEQFKNK